MHIVGASFDTPADNQAWAEDEEFAFELWSDDDKTLALYYGSISKDSTSYAGRVTRILDESGVLVDEFDGVNTSTGPQDVLEDCQALFGK